MSVVGLDRAQSRLEPTSLDAPCINHGTTVSAQAVAASSERCEGSLTLNDRFPHHIPPYDTTAALATVKSNSDHHTTETKTFYLQKIQIYRENS